MIGAEGSLKTYVDMVWRRKWWLVVPCILGVAVAAGLLTRMPKIYQSTATILVTSQRLPEKFVQSTVTMRVQELLQSLEVRLLAPATLEPAVEKFGYLLDDDGNPRSLEQGVRALQRNVRLEYNPRTYSYFRIHVEDRDPRRAAEVAAYLAQWFVDENARMRGQQATSNAERMAAWAEAKEIELTQIDQEIAEFQLAHPMELPEHFSKNVQLLGVAQENIRQISSQIQTTREEIAAINEAQTTRSLVEAIGERNVSPGPTGAYRRWQELQSQLRTLRLDYTDEHMEVQRKLREIDAFLEDHPELGLDDTATGTAEGSAPVPKVNPVLRELELRLSTLTRQLEDERVKVAELQGRLSRIPQHEVEISALLRRRDQIRGDFNELSEKAEEARRSEEMETAGQGEQFKIYDEPRVPGTPSRPVPAMILAMGAAVGLGLGAAIGVTLELVRNAYYSEEDFRLGKPEVPLLVGIPDMDREPDSARRAS